LSDEVYEHITFDGKKHFSLAGSEELAKRTFVISSFGKTYHTTGWKMGYCAAPEYLTKEFRKMHQFIVFSVNTPIQYAYAEFMKQEERYLSLGNFISISGMCFKMQLKIQNSPAKVKNEKLLWHIFSTS
jgi:methionine transaminase